MQEFEKVPPTEAAAGGQKGNGVFALKTPNILPQILTDVEFFEGFRVWCGIPAELEWRRTV